MIVVGTYGESGFAGAVVGLVPHKLLQGIADAGARGPHAAAGEAVAHGGEERITEGAR